MSTQPMLSACCVSGHLHTGAPTGVVKNISGLDVYVSMPDGGSKAKTLLFLTDVFGWELPNARLLADEYALAGFAVYVPDFFQGDPLPHDLLNKITPRDPEARSSVQKATDAADTAAAVGPWILKHPESAAKSLIHAFIKCLRSDPATGKIGAVGFCWGGRHVLLLAAEGNIDAAVTNHPTFAAVPAEFEAVTKPTQINVGDNDPYLANESVDQIKEALLAKKYLETPKEKQNKDECAAATIAWFNKYLA